MTHTSLTRVQPLGSYLVEAGLITHAQLDVALNDQQLMYGMRLGEILVTRGWIKQQTLDYLLKKIIEPEQKATRQVLQRIKQAKQMAKPPAPAQPNPPAAAPAPRSQPTRSTEDVTWVG